MTKSRASSDRTGTIFLLIIFGLCIGFIVLIGVSSIVQSERTLPISVEQEILDQKQKCLDQGGEAKVIEGLWLWEPKVEGVKCEIRAEVG